VMACLSKTRHTALPCTHVGFVHMHVDHHVTVRVHWQVMLMSEPYRDVGRWTHRPLRSHLGDHALTGHTLSGHAMTNRWPGGRLVLCSTFGIPVAAHR
jgi:hypothetical protein